MWRIKILFFILLVLNLLVLARLFYWQILSQDKLSTLAYQQYVNEQVIPARRGLIKSVDGFPFITNETAYLLNANKKELKEGNESLAKKLAPLFAQISGIFLEKKESGEVATSSGKIYIPTEKDVYRDLLNKLTIKNAVWIPLVHKVDKAIKEKIEKLNITGLVFSEEQKRFYPEASMAAQMLGFVGQDYYGFPSGYFGLEGFYDRELRGKPGIIKQEKDAFGRPIVIGENLEEDAEDGRNLILHLDRTVQFIVEEKLKEGIDKYGAKEGSVVIMEPRTGAILAMASYPSYDPGYWYQYDPKLFKNPIVADSYEPGSTFKILVMAAALNENKITPDTRCDKCSGSREIGGFTIRTWNNKYFPNTTMTEVLEHSDNTGMIFVSEKLGKEKFIQYLKAFGFGLPTGIDLQDESTSQLRLDKSWLAIDLATASFGQGIAVTPIQMVRATAVIANGGKLLEPHVVAKVETKDGKIIAIEPKVIRQVISASTAKVLTEMMVNAVDKGEARWAKPQGYRIAGKTGTAQISLAGHYDENRTIASFVGFAPADEPKFVMLVRLTEPTSSPWGSETAAPLFFSIAKELFSYYGIVPK